MNSEFLESKIIELSDDKIIELCNLKNDANLEIVQLAEKEAQKRNLENVFDKSESISLEAIVDKTTENKKELDKWNWGAFFLLPAWTLANRLEKWTIASFIPLLNIFAAFYLGFNGNKLAFEKSNIESIDNFLTIQKIWKIWGIRIFLFSTLVSVVWFLFS